MRGIVLLGVLAILAAFRPVPAEGQEVLEFLLTGKTSGFITDYFEYEEPEFVSHVPDKEKNACPPVHGDYQCPMVMDEVEDPMPWSLEVAAVGWVSNKIPLAKLKE